LVRGHVRLFLAFVVVELVVERFKLVKRLIVIVIERLRRLVRWRRLVELVKPVR
jgi:hypothetical protein